MSRITKKGQVTIPKKIREIMGISLNDIGEFTVKDGTVLFTVKKGTILDAHRKKTNKDQDFSKIRILMESDLAKEATRNEN
jgi:AbrB family looped-hinge helix DNA binding protein